MADGEKEFPEGMVPLGKGSFPFACHPGVPCYTVCCRRVDLSLYPYDLIRLKLALKIDSAQLLQNHTRLVEGDHPYFPALKLRLNTEDSCPFLAADGCRVYQNRPSACRTYPLERAVDRSSRQAIPDEYYFLTHHTYCLGHEADHQQTVGQWIRNQGLLEYNTMNTLWAEMDTLFAGNPWRGEGAAGEKQRLAFMVCYNLDAFRAFVDKNHLLRQFRLDREQRRRIEREDSELLKFGFQWLRLLLTGRANLLPA